MYGPDIPNKAQFPELEQAATRSYGILETCVGDYLSDRGVPLTRVRPAALAAWTACHGLATIMADRQNAWEIVGSDDGMMAIAKDAFSHWDNLRMTNPPKKQAKMRENFVAAMKFQGITVVP
ncbi:TetR-like C-terminal domain-containing protein [Variovorax sp. LjRoot84]|uniref:TetR-like C-terminal domain-containing protein n=1 Tax=Variovorax sp. LjRoot84 TaxID=3342340 RepID=UPI003ED000A5